jgi:hypothetical protein
MKLTDDQWQEIRAASDDVPVSEGPAIMVRKFAEMVSGQTEKADLMQLLSWIVTTDTDVRVIGRAVQDLSTVCTQMEIV